MLAMTTQDEMGSSPQPTSSSDTEEAIGAIQERPKTPIHSGISALIQAATRLLRDVGTCNDDASKTSDAGDAPSSSADVSGRGGDLGLPSKDLTPTMVHETENDLSRSNQIQRKSFPETLMTLLLDQRYSDILTFLPDGKFFAIRAKEFTRDLMKNHFQVTTFDEFLELIDSWGFSRINHRQHSFDEFDVHANPTIINNNGSGIHVFRHPRFEKGDLPSDLTQELAIGHPSRSISSVPERACLDSVCTSAYSSDGDTSASSTTKRRLSPSHLKDSEELCGPQKQRLSLTSVESSAQPPFDAQGEQPSMPASPFPPQRKNSDATDVASTASRRRSVSRRSSNEVRSIALAITTEKLNLSCDDEDEVMMNRPAGGSHETVATAPPKPLIDGAVERATHTIVTDAIETLLRDEGHSRETFLKHEKELSQSALPGLIPISKQLFSPSNTTASSAGTASNLDAAGADSSKLANMAPAAPATPTDEPVKESASSETGITGTPVNH